MIAAVCGVPDLRRWRQLDDRIVDDPCDSIPERVRLSSRGRPWNGLAIWLQDGPTEDLYIPATRKHCIVIRRGTPTRLSHSLGGAMVETLWRTGEAVVVPAGSPSFWRSDASRDNLHIDICPQWLSRAAGPAHAPRVLRSGHGADPLLAQFGQLLLDSLHSNASLSPRFADGIAIALASHLLEHHSDTATPARKTCGLTRRQLDAVVTAVEADLSADWSLERLAGLLQLSPFHFARAFKAASGETPHRLVLRLRLAHARRLVLGSGMPLIDVAVDAGFTSLSHFGQAFRRKWGACPSELRRLG